MFRLIDFTWFHGNDRTGPASTPLGLFPPRRQERYSVPRKTYHASTPLGLFPPLRLYREDLVILLIGSASTPLGLFPPLRPFCATMRLIIPFLLQPLSGFFPLCDISAMSPSGSATGASTPLELFPPLRPPMRSNTRRMRIASTPLGLFPLCDFLLVLRSTGLSVRS
jgi:hypothetical protein